MNFYKHYIGDFQRDTGHLSLTERGAYLALIHHYYATEKPLPREHDALCRVAGAFTPVERKAVKVAMGFFTAVESGLMHNRIEAELHKAGEISNTNRDIALAREAKRRADKDAQIEHEPCTNRAESVPRTEHEQSTPQTPDTRQKTEAKASLSPAKLTTPNCPTEKIIEIYHEVLPELPAVRLKTESRVRATKKFWQWVLTSTKPGGERRAQSLDDGLAWLRDYFLRARDNDFLMGRQSRAGPHENWQCDFDFLLTEKGLKQVIEKTRETA